ncbi:DNA primase [Mycobacterium phage Myrna]|uniref:DNA primase n=1 Tax=Mycobacterium phage Myrna TaxID=546805 RepID=B5LJG0_9CAUD|nr:DNA primase [Mycobacterium phage Myrna]ACH62157.1 DNA primase [Mycobacterium phage Myrna]
MAKTGLAAMKAANVDFADIHRRIDPQAVLDHYGAENQFEQTNLDGTVEVIHSCLVDRVDPHHANGDQNPSAACNLNKKTWVCYSYVDPETNKSGYDMLHLIMKMEGAKEPRDVMDLVRGFLEGGTAEPNQFMAKLSALVVAPESEKTGPPVVRGLSERNLAQWGYTHPYIVERGIDLDTASRLQIGYDPDENRITIPHFWNGRLVGWQKRAIPNRPGEWPGTVPAVPKYRSSPGFPKSETLYRLAEARVSGRVVVVESPFSVIKAEALGVPGVTATFGAKITDHQLDLLKGVDDLVVWMDDDDAGRAAERRLVANLYRHSGVRVVTPDDGKDLGDYTSASDILTKIDQATPGYDKLVQYDREKAEWARRSRVSAPSRPGRR